MIVNVSCDYLTSVSLAFRRISSQIGRKVWAEQVFFSRQTIIFSRQNYFQVLPYPSRVILNWKCSRCQMGLWKCLIKMISVTVSENHFSELIWYVCDWRVAISCFEKMTLRTSDFLKKNRNEYILSSTGFFYSSDIFFWNIRLLLHMYVIFHFNNPIFAYFFCIWHEWIKRRNTFVCHS